MRERFRVNVAKTSITGTHQESISIDEGQLTFCPTVSYIRSPWNCAEGLPQGGDSRPFSIAKRDEIRTLVTRLTILSARKRYLFSRKNLIEGSTSVLLRKAVSYHDFSAINVIESKYVNTYYACFMTII